MRKAGSEHIFQDQLHEGKRAEHFLDIYFARWFHIHPVSLDTELRDGYDRVFQRRNNAERLKIEYKADWQASDTGNAFIETISVYEERKPGWAYTSQADMLIYFVPPRGAVYMLPLSAIRFMLASWKLRYREVPAPNQGYKTYGILVPLLQFGRFGNVRQVAVMP
jgi:hypothetical protein